MSAVWGVFVFFAGAAVGAVFGFHYDQLAMRPKLAASGGGIGRGGSYSIASVSIENTLGFLGVPRGRMILFGKPIWLWRRRGDNYVRHPATVRALITRTDGGDDDQAGAQSLYFQGDGGTAQPQAEVLSGGQSVLLNVMGWHAEARKFFIPVPSGQSGESWSPGEDAMFTGPARFRIDVIPIHGGRPLRMSVSLVQDGRGDWHMKASYKGGGVSTNLSADSAA